MRWFLKNKIKFGGKITAELSSTSRNTKYIHLSRFTEYTMFEQKENIKIIQLKGFTEHVCEQKEETQTIYIYIYIAMELELSIEKTCIDRENLDYKVILRNKQNE